MTTIYNALQGIDPNRVAAKLQDLNALGIRVQNPRGVCCRCRALTMPHSDGHRANAQCKSCDEAYPIPHTKELFYVIARQGSEGGTCYDAIVKIDGVVYLARYSHGFSYDIMQLDGQVARSFGLGLSCNKLKLLYDQQDNEGTPRPVSLITYYWPEVKEAVSGAIGRCDWAMRIPFYDIGHAGRGIEEEGRVIVRLFVVRRHEYVRPDEFVLVGVQLVRSNAEQYPAEFYPTPLDVPEAILQWSQAGELLTGALLGLESDPVRHGYEGAIREHQRAVDVGAVPADWHVVLRPDPPYGMSPLLLLPA